ncbi:NAD(P)H-flavin reductase [Vibrio quintilis]|uniref:NAD(P)H-flavin reductase n=1 Tax=Vibrio quintilis TaxID=1117707 RepID=A0A1M7YZG3_9VIBR|nr:NAD(P)H-flavin reductase [Vibrio quintilis]SHO58031.1 NAD(P)H-flavin reductase [Vibrio quintilis]
MIIQSKVKSIQPLASNTYKILLLPSTPVSFKPGQYLMVVMGEQDKRPFSIASSPCRHEGELELHIGAAEHNAYAFEVVEMMKAAMNDDLEIHIDVPHGDAWLRENSERDLLLIAGGTGFSYVRSILDHCLSQSLKRNIFLYWGAKDSRQLYAMDELYQIEKQNDNIKFIPVIEMDDSQWQGKTGNVIQAVSDDFESLADVDVYIAGRFEMAGVAREQFTLNKHARSDHIYGDAYSFI